MIREKILETITKYNLIEKGDKIVLGVSGGPDSISMLVLLNELKEKLDFEIVVAHINHGIRENAKIDEEYVKSFCERLNVKFYVLHAQVLDIAKQEKRGVEETGRKVRYEFFNEILEKENAKKIAIAHNKNDNSETIIMNIMRGSGIVGLKGIEAKQGIYIRPLIEISRDEIEDFCEKENLNPRHDESNDENEYTRNKIRNIVIPFIKNEFNPNIVQSLTNLSEIAREQERYIEKETFSQYKNILLEEVYFKNEVYSTQKMSTIILDLKKFNLLDVLIQKKIILYSIKKIFGSTKGIEKVHLEDMIKLCNNNIGNKFLTPNKNLKIEIKNKKIHISYIK